MSYLGESYPEPKYLGEGGEVASGWFREATQEPEVRTASGVNTSYLATGKATNGQFGLYRWDTTGKPAGPKPHFHRSISESFFVVSGTMRLYDGAKWIDGKPGDFLFVPEGGIHAFRNESGEPASMLILFAPGAPREGYFEGLAEIGLSGRQPSEEEMIEFYLRHDTFWT